MKAVVAAFNQEKALVGAFSVITNLRMELFEALVQELTDVDTMNESEEGSEALLAALVKHQVCSLLVTNLERMDEAVKEESEGVHNTLAIIENLVELRPEMCKDVAEVVDEYKMFSIIFN